MRNTQVREKEIGNTEIRKKKKKKKKLNTGAACISTAGQKHTQPHAHTTHTTKIYTNIEGHETRAPSNCRLLTLPVAPTNGHQIATEAGRRHSTFRTFRQVTGDRCRGRINSRQLPSKSQATLTLSTKRDGDGDGGGDGGLPAGKLKDTVCEPKTLNTKHSALGTDQGPISGIFACFLPRLGDRRRRALKL